MVEKFLDNKLLIIRADAFKEIGSGHVMRCMALAQEWLNYNGRVIFISYCESKSIRNTIISENIKLIPIDKPAYDQKEIKNIINIANKSVPKSKKEIWFVLDGYSFDQDYQKAIMNAGYKLIVIDDINHNLFYHANILLNQNLHADELEYKTGNDTLRLLGPKYALLRKEFWHWRNWKRHNPPIASKILITLGGSDNKNLTGTVLNALKKVKINNMEIAVVIGPTNKNISKIKKELIAAKKYKYELIKSPSDISRLMSWADIAISAGGSTSWEIAFMGLPSVGIALSENQKEIVDDLDNKKALYNLGWYEDVNQNKIASAVKEIMLNQKTRDTQTKVKNKLVDGLGCERVIKTVLLSNLKLRKVNVNDCQLLWQWANDPDVRKSAFMSQNISWDEHELWFSKKISDKNCFHYLMINDQSEAIGQIRFDVKNNVANMDYSIADKYRGFGMGVNLLQLGINKMETKIKSPITFIGNVKKENKASKNTFMQSGFVKVMDKKKISKFHEEIKADYCVYRLNRG